MFFVGVLAAVRTSNTSKADNKSSVGKLEVHPIHTGDNNTTIETGHLKLMCICVYIILSYSFVPGLIYKLYMYIWVFVLPDTMGDQDMMLCFGI